MKSVYWNYTDEFILEKITKYIMYLFFINNIRELELNFIATYLKAVFKDNEIILKKNNKIRNINTYIKEKYNGFKNLFHSIINKEFKLDNEIVIVL